MTVAPVKRLLCILAALLALLVATVAMFEVQQAKREPAVFGGTGPEN